MNDTSQEPWLFCEAEERIPLIGNRRGFELLKDEIEKLLASEEGIVSIECESFAYSELKIEERHPVEECTPLGRGRILIFYAILAAILVIIVMTLFLAVVGLIHLIS